MITVAALTALLAGLPAAAAGAQPGSPGGAGSSVISWFNGSQAFCLSAHAAQPRAPAALTACPSFAWHVTPGGKIRLLGSRLYLGSFHGKAALRRHGPSWVYQSHTLAEHGRFLTWCLGSPAPPFLARTVEPGCQTWYVFTKL